MKKYIVILGKQISWYSIMGFLGLGIATLFCVRRRDRYHLRRDDLINMMGYAIVGGLIGAKLLALLCMVPQFVTYWDKITWNGEFIAAIMGNGFVFYGGLLGMLSAFGIYCAQYRINYKDVLELIAPAIPLFHVFGRIGCYIAECCGGINGFPIQLVESGMNFGIFLLLYILQNLQKMKGKTFFLYLLSYGIGRFILEFFRGDAERGFIWFFSVSQWISAGLIVVACFYLMKQREKARD